MSVASPVIDFIDPTARRIYLLAGVREYHPIDDIYTEVRDLRRTDETLRPFDMFVGALTVFDKGGGRFTPRALVLLLGTRIVPEDTSHTLKVLGEQLTDDGGSGSDALDLTQFSPGVVFVGDYAPAEAEIIQVGGAVAATDLWNHDLGGVTAGSRLTSADSDAESLIDILCNNGDIVVNPDTTKTITVYEDNGTTIRAQWTISADGLTRTRVV